MSLSYWKNPGPENRPETYKYAPEKTDYLVRLVSTYCRPDARILELGCNCGRNLIGLHEAGFKNLWGWEVNEAACNLIPDYVSIVRGSFEERQKFFIPNYYDLIFTMAVLCHLPPESEFVFPLMKARMIITIEPEDLESDRMWKRDYGIIFKALGMSEVFAESFLPPLVTRVFVI